MPSHSSSEQRRPRLLRASMTSPSIVTSVQTSTQSYSSYYNSSFNSFDSYDSFNAFNSSSGTYTYAHDMPSTASGSTSPTTASYHRRAADLLSHVAYLSSCAAAPVSSLIGRAGSTSSQASQASTASLDEAPSKATSAPSRPEYRREAEVFGSSPASSTHTASSLDSLDLDGRSANYYSFPSFDTWDPEFREKEEDAEE